LCDLAALLLVGVVYAWWVQMPILPPRSLEQAYLEGVIGALVCGALLSLVVAKLLEVAALTVVAVIAGHAWAEQHSTDVTLSFVVALQETVHRLQRYHVVLMGLLLVGWMVGRWVAGRARTRPAVEQQDEADKATHG
jgi:hypothetical protein